MHNQWTINYFVLFRFVCVGFFQLVITSNIECVKYMQSIRTDALLTKLLDSCIFSLYGRQHALFLVNKSKRFKINFCLETIPVGIILPLLLWNPKKKLFCGLRFFWTRRRFSCQQRKSHLCSLVDEGSLLFLRGIRCGIFCNVPCIWCITVFCGKIT